MNIFFLIVTVGFSASFCEAESGNDDDDKEGVRVASTASIEGAFELESDAPASLEDAAASLESAENPIGDTADVTID